MKFSTYRYLAVPVAAACCLCSCKDEGPKEPSVPQAPQIKTATPAERAARLPLLELVPAESSSVYALYDIPSVVQSFMDSHTGDYVISAGELKKGANIDKSEEEDAVSAETEVDTTKLMSDAENGSASVPLPSKRSISVPVKNVVIAGGSDMPALMTKLAPVLGKCSEVMQRENTMNLASSNSGDREMGKKFISLGIEMLDKIDLESETGTAPIFIAVEMDNATADQVKNTVAQFGMMAGLVSQGALMPSTMETGGVAFSGVKLDGPKASKMAAASLAQSGLGLDVATVNKIINKIATAKVHLLVGFKGNVCMLVFCANPSQQLKFPASPAESILGKSDFAFVDGHLDSQAFSILFATPPTLKSLLDVSKAYSKGQMDGLVSALNNFQQELKLDKTKVDQMCANITALTAEEQKMYDFYDVTQPMSFYSWWNKGLVGEINFGANNIYDWDHSAASMSGVLNVPDNAFSLIISLAPSYENLLLNLCEQGGELAWNALGLVASNEEKGEECKKYYERIKPFVPLISSVWNASRKTTAGYDSVRGYVLDLNGTFPAGIKDIPENILKNGRIPRLASVVRVSDMSKLSAAWDEGRKALEANKTILQPLVGNIDLAKPLEEKGSDGLTFYSYPIPDTGNDWSPALAVGDSLIASGSSRNFIPAVVQASLKPDANAIVPTVYGPLGACIRMDSAPWAKCASTWAQVMETTAPDDATTLNMRTVADVLNAISKDIKGIRMSISKENGKIVERFSVENIK